MQTPTSQSASVKASRRRAAYGAPDAPVTPREDAHGARSFGCYFPPFEASRKAAIA
jgi:hypothetical protein